MKRVLSGMRPTGKLHLGHWVGALSNWIKLQDSYDCFFMIADWHALMSEYKNSSNLKGYVFDNLCDWITWGISPKKSTIFVQSHVKEHLELFMFFSFLTPLGWLFRCPTFKEQLNQLKDKEINTYAFLGYPVLQASDILLYNADYVPVGEDQLPHLELCREIARRFHFIYNTKIFVEPEAILTKTPRLLGIDNRKMSKSYNNYISLDEEDNVIEEKILSMFTDPSRIKKEDKGHPDICNVYSYYTVFCENKKEEIYKACSSAEIGCVECKKLLAKTIKDFIAPKREEKKKLLKDKDYIYNIILEGRNKASKVANNTMDKIKDLVGLL